MLDYETFKCVIRTIKLQKKLDRKRQKAFDSIIKGNPIYIGSDVIIDELINVLSIAMEDHHNLIYYFVEETDFGRKTSLVDIEVEIGDELIQLDSIRSLYDSLIYVKAKSLLMCED
jgi:hypothetical protein